MLSGRLLTESRSALSCPLFSGTPPSCQGGTFMDPVSQDARPLRRPTDRHRCPGFTFFRDLVPWQPLGFSTSAPSVALSLDLTTSSRPSDHHWGARQPLQRWTSEFVPSLPSRRRARTSFGCLHLPPPTPPPLHLRTGKNIVSV